MATSSKPGLHDRNPHRDGYDFEALTAARPDLAPFLVTAAHGRTTLDFANPEAVKALNRALLHHHYGIVAWDLPPGYLCPPVPGRADHLHRLADLLAESQSGTLPPGKAIRVLDVGTGANLIYPILGRRTFGWRFVGTDIDAEALAAAQRVIHANPTLAGAIQLRRQRQAEHIFKGVVKPEEAFDLTLCNPPFHASPQAAQAGSRRKWENLGRPDAVKGAPVLNFGGGATELWCPGGEGAFVGRIIAESAGLKNRVLWFSSLISKAENLPRLRSVLRQYGAQEIRELDMVHGQKRSRILAWTFLDPEAREAWAAARWAGV